MKYDDPKLTAYALGELDEAIELDEGGAKVVEETALVASVLRQHFRRPRRRLPKLRYALAASLLIAIAAMLVTLSRSSQRETIAVVPVEQPVMQVASNSAPILRLTPVMAESTAISSLTNADFRGIRALDVEQLVAAVFQDASRVGSFTSLRLMPEPAVAFQ
jgi:hypothetical protein